MRVILQALHPNMLPDEAHVLRHMFFVNGNGLDWVDGQLVDRLGIDLDGFHAEMTQRDRDFIQRMNEWEIRYQEHVRMANVFGFEPEDHDIYVFPRMVNNTEIYPLSQFCLIMCIPDDIQDDWLDAAFRALDVAKQLKKTRSDIRYLKQARQRLNAIKKTRKLPALKPRLKPNPQFPDEDYPEGYVESEYVMNNFHLCLKLLEKHERETAVSRKE